ncbi:hypothetical protein GF407_04000 [candidate division KSB1 bacterium]|nr:hypothetical protein [candidate division KSB1 bacterium]
MTISHYYRLLPDSLQQDCAVYTSNYGEAAAIDYSRDTYPLPPAISGHNNYYLWGYGSISGQHLITIGSKKEDLERGYKTVELLGYFQAPYIMPYENNSPIYYCSGLKTDLSSGL